VCRGSAWFGGFCFCVYIAAAAVVPVCLVEDDDDVVGGQWDHACLPSFRTSF
jgi:hypothetical protein